MAVLSAGDRALVAALINRDSGLSIQGLLKSELRAAVDAVDQWVDDNSGAYNTAIPLTARNALNPRQKAALLMYVVERRFGIL